MSVVNYYCLEGEMLGDSLAGDYVRDALGSVTGTTSSSTGALQNTYRYMAYGDLLSKTGTDPVPKFLWVGTAGYRQTSLFYSGVYIRARHYAIGEGRWTTVDPLWPQQPSYGYVSGKPTVATDPSGMFDEMTVMPVSTYSLDRRAGSCGYVEWDADWHIPGVYPWDPINGAVIQHIHISGYVTDCTTGIGTTYNDEYLEQWPVRNGHILVGRSADGWPSTRDTFGYAISGHGGLDCSKGTVLFEGKAAFYRNYINERAPWIADYSVNSPRGHQLSSGDLLVITREMLPYFSQREPYKTFLSHHSRGLKRMQLSWDCCVCGKYQYDRESWDGYGIVGGRYSIGPHITGDKDTPADPRCKKRRRTKKSQRITGEKQGNWSWPDD